MNRPRLRFAGLLLACVLLLPGCEALDFLIDLYDVTDLVEDDDPATQAAGHSPEITKKIEEADQTVQEVLEGDKPPETLDDLRIARPQDAKIANYVFWLALLDGDTATMLSASDAARRLHAATVGTTDETQADRLWLQQNLDVMSDVLNSQAPGPDASADATERFGSLQRQYCDTLRNFRTEYGSMPEGMLYLQFASDQGCGVV